MPLYDNNLTFTMLTTSKSLTVFKLQKRVLQTFFKQSKKCHGLKMKSNNYYSQTILIALYLFIGLYFFLITDHFCLLYI